MTVIYRSKPFATVTSTSEKAEQGPKSIKRMLEFAELARNSARAPLSPGLSYKDAYHQDMTKKYDIS